MPGGARPIGTIRTLPHHPQGCWGAFFGVTRRFGDACEFGLTFHKALLHLCGHLRGIRGGGSNSHTSQQRLPFNTAARGAHRVGSWGLALGSEPADQELAIDHSSPGLAARLHWPEGDSSQPAYLSRALQSRAMLGFSLFQGSVGEDTGLLARNSWSYENKFMVLRPRAAQPSTLFSDHGDQDTCGGQFSIFGTTRPRDDFILFRCSRQFAADARKKLSVTHSSEVQLSKNPCDNDYGTSNSDGEHLEHLIRTRAHLAS